MYLYLGQSTVINTKDIVAILDLENTSTSRFTKAFLRHAQKTGQVVEVSQEIPRSYVVCRQGKENKVYLSQISPATLKKRTGFLYSV